MNFYKHHLGDYDGHTAHLSWDEDMAYTRLIRAYYRREGPIPDSEKYRLTRASSKAQRAAVDTVLLEFFVKDGDVWRQKRCDEEIAAYQAQAATNRRIARQRTVNESLTNRSPATVATREPNQNQNQINTIPRAQGAVRPEAIPEELWSDFLAIRKAKKAPFTDTAFSGLQREAAAAGVTVQKALEVCCERGWQSFKASWFLGQKQQKGTVAI